MEVSALSRTAKPIQLYEAKGNPNRLTKAEIERRKSSEIKVKNKTFKASENVMADQRALQEFKRLKKLYKDIEFVGALDEHIINQYCLSVSELDDLLVALKVARDKMRAKSAKTRGKGLAEFLALDTEVRMKRQEIIRLADRLYLDPVARTKNVPKKENKNVGDDPNAEMFD